MQRAAEYRLRFALFRYNDSFQAMLSRPNPAIAAYKIGISCPLHEQLRHDGVVVVVDGDVTVGTRFRFRSAG